MRRLASSTCMSIALALTAAAQTQQQPASWALVSYLKVPAVKMAEFEQERSTTYRKMMEGRITAGEVTRCIATRMIAPAGSEAKYNYMIAVIETGVPKLDRDPAEVEKDWSRVGLKRATYMDKMTTLGVVLVKRELWRNIERLGTVEAGDFVRYDTKKVSKPGDYVNQERTYHKAYWAERIKQGALKGWAFFYVSLPAGEDRPYSFLTVQCFKDEQQMYGPSSVPPAESWKVAAPGKDPWQINRDTLAVSHTATVELGRVRMVLGHSMASSGGGR